MKRVVVEKKEKRSLALLSSVRVRASATCVILHCGATEVGRRRRSELCKQERQKSVFSLDVPENAESRLVARVKRAHADKA